MQSLMTSGCMLPTCNTIKKVWGAMCSTISMQFATHQLPEFCSHCCCSLLLVVWRVSQQPELHSRLAEPESAAAVLTAAEHQALP